VQRDRACVGVDGRGAGRDADRVAVAESDGLVVLDDGEPDLRARQVGEDAGFDAERPGRIIGR
jgi:hypothetical protein